MRRVLIIANKSWEADGLVNTLLHEKVRPKSFTSFQFLHHPFLIESKDVNNPDPAPTARISFACADLSVELWCIQDLMDPKQSGSATMEKARVFPRILAGQPPALVIAFGTAAFPGDVTLNGSVVIGTRVFVHNPYPPDPKQWQPNPADTTVDSTLVPKDIFRSIQESARFAAENRFVQSPMAASRPPVIVAGHAFVSLGVVNVTNYDDCGWIEPQALEAFKQNEPKWRLGSLETTHGMIRQLSGNSPFLYISGIANLQGHFDLEAVPRVYSQNMVAVHNAAVAATCLIPELVQLLPP
jgi:hypothetical protein